MRLRSLIALLSAGALLATSPAIAQTRVQLRNPTNTGFVGTVADPLVAQDPVNASFTTAAALTVGAADVAVGRAVGLVCTGAGNVSLKLSVTAAYVVPVNVGLSVLPFAAVGVNASGTTATCTYANLS